METLRSETESGRIFHPTLEHPVLTPEGWIPAGSLEVGDVLGLRVGNRILPDRIIKIEDGGRLLCRCLTVPSEGSFLVNDLIVSNSGGKESTELSLKRLARFGYRAARPSDKKGTRLLPFLAQCEAGNVFIVKAPWSQPYLAELLSWSETARVKDQADASSGAINQLLASDWTFGGDAGIFEDLARYRGRH